MLIPGNVVRASRMRLRNRMWLCNTLVRLFLASIIITDLIGASKDERDAELIRSETGGGDVIARRQLTFTMMCKSEAKSRCDTNEIDVCVCGAVMVALENQFFQRRTNERTNDKGQKTWAKWICQFLFSSLLLRLLSSPCISLVDVVVPSALSQGFNESSRDFLLLRHFYFSLSSLGRIRDTRV